MPVDFISYKNNIVINADDIILFEKENPLINVIDGKCLNKVEADFRIKFQIKNTDFVSWYFKSYEERDNVFIDLKRLISVECNGDGEK